MSGKKEKKEKRVLASLARAQSPCIEIGCVCLFLLFREIIVLDLENRASCLLKQCLVQSGALFKAVPCSKRCHALKQCQLI